MSSNPIDILRRTREQTSLISETDIEEEISSLPPNLRALFSVRKDDVISGGRFDSKVPDVGVLRAFGGGIKGAFLEPLSVLGLEIEEAELDETSEKVANLLGTFIGYGIGFIPFMAGTGWALKGFGLTKAWAGAAVKAGTEIPKLTRALAIAKAAPFAAGKGEKVATAAIQLNQAVKSKALYSFTRNTIAGSAQFAGMADEIEDVPKQLAIGAAFGTVVEGAMLGWAIRGRRLKINDKKFFETGNPNPDMPLDAATRQAENVVAPSTSDTPAMVSVKLEALLNGETYDGVKAAIIKNDLVETMTFPALSEEGAGTVVADLSERLSQAQVLRRETRTKGVHEVMAFNPFDPEDLLTPAQIKEWERTGFFSGQGVKYRGDLWEVTGKGVVEGRIQLRVPASKGQVFAASIDEVTVDPEGRIFRSPQRMRSRVIELLREQENEVGVVLAEGEESARRYIVNIEDFVPMTEAQYKDWSKGFAEQIGKEEFPSAQEAIAILAERQDIPGVTITENGRAVRYIIFDTKGNEYGRGRTIPVVETVRLALRKGDLVPTERIELPGLSKEGVVGKEGTLRISPGSTVAQPDSWGVQPDIAARQAVSDARSGRVRAQFTVSSVYGKRAPDSEYGEALLDLQTVFIPARKGDQPAKIDIDIFTKLAGLTRVGEGATGELVPTLKATNPNDIRAAGRAIFQYYDSLGMRAESITGFRIGEGVGKNRQQTIPRRAFFRGMDDPVPSPSTGLQVPIDQLPRFPLVVDEAVYRADGTLLSFVPTWRNAISGPLRHGPEGRPEKEISVLLDMYARQQTDELANLVDDEVRAILNRSSILEGCP